MSEGELLQPPSDAETLVRILNRTASLLQARGCGVFIWDREKNALSAMRPFSSVDDALLKGIELPVGGTTMGNAVLQDRSVLLERANINGHEIQLLNQLEINNAVCVPLALERRDENNDVAERTVIGLLCAYDKYYSRQFDMEDARLLGMMARQASAVLVTSQLFWKEVEGRKRIMSMIESTSVGLMAISPKGTVTQINAAARRALGLTKDGWFGHNYQEVILHSEICGVIADSLDGNPPEEPKELSLYVAPNEGEEKEERIYRVQVDQIQSEDAKSLGWVIVFENITDIRQAERMMSAFVDMISHELRTPLTSIRGFVATLIQAGEGVFPWETQEEFLQIVDTEAERLGHMIDEQLNIARIQNGRGLQYHWVPTNVKKVAENVVRLQAQSSNMKSGHRMVVDIPDDFHELQADEAKIVQVMHNLVSNALKYSPNGGEVRISAFDTTHEGVEGVQISVRDHGIGIPPEFLPKVMQQFVRVESQGHKGIKGTGLGLWLSKHMVEGHGGTMWLESVYGEGTTFHFILPHVPAPPPGTVVN